MEDKIIGNVYESYDYDKFKKLLGNRNIKLIERIIKSINAVTQLHVPIIVNEKYEVIDGQNRFEAWEKLNLPIIYIVCDGYGIKECIAMNTTSLNWTIEDYINCYAEYGYADYIALRDFEKAYSHILPKSVIRSVCGGMVANIPTKDIKAGNFRLAKPKEEIESVFEFLSMFEIPKTMRGNTKLIYCVLRFCYERADIDNVKMLKQWQSSASQVQGITDIRSAAEAVEKIYNYRCSGKNFVYIATEYRKAAEHNCAGKVGGGNSSWGKEE